jgi:hypothetical protein
VPTTTVTSTVATGPGDYPIHTNINATTFWVGEEFNPNAADGSQACSTYDSQWAFHWSGGVTIGSERNAGCTGAPVGGCDGVAAGSTVATFTCNTERRVAPTFFPTQAAPAENPFYVDLPYDDVNNTDARRNRCAVIPWAPETGCTTDPSTSYMKNRWVQITGPNGQTCYGQIEDAGPDHYDSESYVFGANDARPQNDPETNNAGMDVSPALNGCLGFKDLDGDDDRVTWRFVDQPAPGPWTRVVTSSPVTP